MTTKGIKITSGQDMESAKETDFVVDSEIGGSFRVANILSFKYGGELTAMSVPLGYNAYIQKYTHSIGYVPAYIAYKVTGDVANPTSISYPFNDFITVVSSHFVNVTSTQVIVGFDSSVHDIDLIRVILFAEKLADS